MARRVRAPQACARAHSQSPACRACYSAGGPSLELPGDCITGRGGEQARISRLRWPSAGRQPRRPALSSRLCYGPQMPLEQILTECCARDRMSTVVEREAMPEQAWTPHCRLLGTTRCLHPGMGETSPIEPTCLGGEALDDFAGPRGGPLQAGIPDSRTRNRCRCRGVS